MLPQDVVIDPFLLCIPNPCNSLDQLEDFISAIVGWRGFLDRPDICALLSDSARVALNDDGEFPHRHRLVELIDKFECTFADANTISRVANSILERTPALEEHFGIDSILIEEDSIEIAPAGLLDRLKPNCRAAFRDDLLIAGIKVDERVAGESEASVMIASGSSTEDPIPSAIFVKADIHDIELVSTDFKLHTAPPFLLSQSITIAFSHEQLIESLDLEAIWDGASSDEAVRLSVEARIKSIISSGARPDRVTDFSIGNGFVRSLHAWNADSRLDFAMVTIESCARIALGIPKNLVKEFRESEGVNAKQRARKDGALAYRTHLTKKGVGLRLMFWKHTDGTIEFANIGGKGELEIS
jgi:hypothetical protein